MSHLKYFISLSLNSLILVSYLILFFYKIDNLLIITYLTSLFIAFFAENGMSRQKALINNSVILLVLFLFLYGIFNAVISLVIDGEISKAIYFSTLFYGSSIPALSLGSLLIIKRNNSIHIENNKNINKAFKVFLFLVLLILIIYKSFFLYSENLLFNPSALKDKLRFELFEVSQLWVVSGYLISGIFLYTIYYYRSFRKKELIVAILFFSYYLIALISIGNRREIIIILIGVFWVWVNKSQKKFRFLSLLSLLIGIFIFLVISNFRVSNIDDMSLSVFIANALSSNEFVYPFYTLSFSVQSWLDNAFSPLFGLSIFVYPILIFIPRVIFPMKPNSLAMDFVMDNFGGGMGYAYSPVTEAFVNFGLLGPFIVFLLIGIIVARFTSIKDQRFNYLFFTMIPDFCRGEISAFIYQFVFISVFLIFMPFIFNFFSRKI